MEMLFSQAEQLPSLLAVSRSGLVRSWDAVTLQRALGWSHFFRQLHNRIHCQPGLRAALERRLRRGRRFSLGHLRRCPELLGLALLENRALSPSAYQCLLSSLLSPGCLNANSFVPLLARRRAASQLLCQHLVPPPEGSVEHHLTPQLRAQAQLLLLRLQEEEGSSGGPHSSLLGLLPCGPMLYRVVAAALLESSREVESAVPLLHWLLWGEPARFSAFCHLLPASWMASLCGRHPELRAHYFSLLATWGSRLSYDLLQGKWKVEGLEEDQVPWQELRERVHSLLQGPEPLCSAVGAQLKRLKAQDGGFEVQGLSVWTDLLLDMETNVPG